MEAVGNWGRPKKFTGGSAGVAAAAVSFEFGGGGGGIIMYDCPTTLPV